MLAMTEVAGCTMTLSGFEFALVPDAVVSVAVNAYAPPSKSAVVKLQTKELLAVVAPGGFAPSSHTVTVALAGAVPVRVTE
jgi:hypothetical protein